MDEHHTAGSDAERISYTGVCDVFITCTVSIKSLLA